ncbi:MAG: preprotein translocase subunit SecG [Oscillospiraceae bacterium]|nr:preprotein translocase subunit SecG [Oscillospiraceae bacterium]
MGVVKIIGIIIYAIVCITIIILALLQAKDSAGASGAVVGGNSSDGEKSFYEKNIGRTKEGKMRRWTVILTIVFVILTLGFGIFLELVK